MGTCSPRSSPPPSCIALIFALARSGRGAIAAPAVGAYIGAAYWFTSSTSFANPAVTIGRVFSDTFAGIAPGSAAAFIVAQLVGLAVGAAVVLALYPDVGAHRRRRRHPPPRRHPTRPRRPQEPMTPRTVHRHPTRTPPSSTTSPTPTTGSSPARASPPRSHAARDLLEPAATVTTYLPILVARQAKEQLMSAAQAEGRIAKTVPELLFVCVHNAGRSQMAAALAEHLSAHRVHVRSAGSAPAGQVNPLVVKVLAERGIALTTAYPKPLSDNVVARRRRDHHDGLRRRLPDLPRQALRGLGRRRPRRTAHRGRPRHPRRHPGPCHHPAARHPQLTPTPQEATMSTAPDHPARPSLRLRPQRRPLPDGRRLHPPPVRRRRRGPLRRLRTRRPGQPRRPSPPWPRKGIDITAEKPKILTTEAVQASDVVITMGCGDTCPIFPGKRYEDWDARGPRRARAWTPSARSATRSRRACSTCSSRSTSIPSPPDSPPAHARESH